MTTSSDDPKRAEGPGADAHALPATRALRVLVVDDEESMRHFLVRGLRRRGHEVEATAAGDAALALASQRRFDIAVVDLRLPGIDGLQVLARLRALDPAATVLLMTAHGTVATAVDAMKLGAADFVQKPFDLDELCLRIDRALELQLALRENAALRDLLRSDRPGVSASASKAMRALEQQIDLLRGSDATVLLCGESGTGKSVLARRIHEHSPRAAGPFVVVTCPAIPETLFESTLFGHEVGAFTGAVQPKAGLAARAQGGTLFLDEIGELSLATQAKLERFLQYREFTPLGAAKPQQADVRIVAATNRDLAAGVEDGSFRAELLWRLKVVQLQVPPLRQRREDVPTLVVHFLRRLAERAHTPPKTVTAEALAGLAAYDWPGNVRELENLTERMAVLAGARDVLGMGDLPDEVRGIAASGDDGGDYESARERFDRAYFQALLVRAGGSVTEAARLCGISRGHLHRRLRELAIETDAARGLDTGAPGPKDADGRR